MVLDETLGALNMCCKFHRNPPNSCQDISLKKYVNLLVVLKEKSEVHQSH